MEIRDRHRPSFEFRQVLTQSKQRRQIKTSNHKQPDMTTVLVILTIIILPVLYNTLVPLKTPRLHDYFKSGQTFSSQMEGVTQTIIKQVGDKVYSELKLAPGAAGPPEHMHMGFDESGTITKGTLTVKLNDEVVEMSAGSRINFPGGQYHTFSNQTNSEVVIKCKNCVAKAEILCNFCIKTNPPQSELKVWFMVNGQQTVKTLDMIMDDPLRFITYHD